MIIKRGDVWRVALGARDRGPRKTLACVVISPPELHDFLDTVIVAPVSPTDKAAPFRVALRIEGRRGVILLDQLRVMKKNRLVMRIGKVGPSALRNSLGALQRTFAP